VPEWLHASWTHWRNVAAPVQLLAATFQALAAGIGIIVGAMWALSIFFRKREHFPRLNVEHHVVDWRVGDARILHVAIRAENKGSVIAQIRRAKVWVQQILPTPDDIAIKIANGEDPMRPGESEIQWPLATDVVRECDWTGKPEEIEPSETCPFYFDFILPQHIRAVQVYSFLQNDMKARDFGWNTTTVHALTGVLNGEIADVQPPLEGAGASKADAQTRSTGDSKGIAERHDENGNETRSTESHTAAPATDTAAATDLSLK